MPPSPDQRWYLTAVDALAQDEGEIIGFTVYDGEDPYQAVGLPVPIADADPVGTTVIVDGSGEAPETPDIPGIPGGDDDGGNGDPADGAAVDLVIEHTYTGDLSVTAGVLDAEGTPVCTIEALRPRAGERGDGGLEGRIDLGDCAEAGEPGPDTVWFVQVVDTAAVDEGTVESAVLTTPGGDTVEFDDLPVSIPDNTPQGVLLLADGETAGPVTDPGARVAPTLTVDVDHPYAGDLSVEVGAVGPGDEVLCQEQVATPDPSDDTIGLSIEAVLADCAPAFPPSADRQWYLLVVDTLARDVGTLTAATLTGPDGEVYEIDAAGARIPDADPDGVLTFFRPA